ncbi:MAG: hypothetical protein SGI86_07540 [Deltaproteobacteria bacterium]|nr:hypothetical protein [Deltaproteobacteria bacterium]
MKNRKYLLGAALLSSLAASVSGCARKQYLPGTTVQDTPENRAVLETIEKYRERLMARNIEGLLVLASKDYFEDSGTPRADDDYGYEGLKIVLAGRLARLKNLRYQIRYYTVRMLTPKNVEVDVYIDGSFEIGSSEVGERYRRVNDNHRFIMVRTNLDADWRFVSGM